MKYIYHDFIIVPIIAMYIVLTSFAYNEDIGADTSDNLTPAASISPESINLGDDVWYAEGSRGNDCFTSSSVKNLSIDDMHLMCSDSEGKNYDLIFVDTMTAYDCNSGVYYARADYDSLSDEIQSGKFINNANYNDYYIFKGNGKSTECFGDKVYRGKWSLDTSSTLVVYDNTCKGYMNFNILFNAYGDVSGITYNGNVYSLVT